ncbi:MAG: hypothetical protein HY860_00360, partial [Chlamydiales bacterium]|nr:hypothetical protein [Chlamydiales bacterium]
MSISNHIKRLFFGFSLTAPWEELSPPARLLKEEDRHLTIYFLGNVPLFSLEGLPFPSFSIGAVGIFDHLLFLPPHYPNVV